LQKETSQAFNLGILMKTSDGGLTWQTFDLPTAAPIHFISQTDGWMMDHTRVALYQTSDGGITWLSATLDQYPLNEPSLPEGATLSGWQTDSFGWTVTSTGTCSGIKSNLGFTCQVNNALWQSVDAGQTWKAVPLPKSIAPEP
jgi:photosystem II stability/assembly factor-like uncharacterized protein